MPETDVVTIEAVIQQAIQLEREAESLYARWQRAFASYPPIALLWQEYAEEEAEHARLLEDILAHLPVEQRRQPAARDITEAMQRAGCVGSPLFSSGHAWRGARTRLRNREFRNQRCTGTLGATLCA